MPTQPQHRSILALDIEGFSRPERTNPIQLGLHQQLQRLLTDALRAAGIRARQCELHDTGDGWLVTISPEVPKPYLLDPLLAELANRLDGHNRAVDAANRLRLRIAIHAGEVMRDAQASVGHAVVFACRLLDAPQLRACLAATDAPLVMAASEWVYQEVVRHGYGGLDPDDWRPIRFTSKTVSGHAWVHVPGDPDAVGRAGVAVAWDRSDPAPRLVGAGAVPVGEVFQLPADIPDFTGREQAVEQLVRLLGGDSEDRPNAVVVSAVAGKGGVGKTTLAVHAAHQLIARFPDGQLFVNLHGMETDTNPLAPADVLGELLRALGADATAIPDTLDARQALYRTRLAGRRVLVVLDNAADERQVRPLLPGSGSCGVLVTSRAPMEGLAGAGVLHVDVLDPPHAIELLAKICGGDRVAAEPHMAARIAELCGGLPLAVRIAGARLAARPHWPLARLAERLADERHRLDELQAGDLAVRTSFLISYQSQTADDREAFRRLGLAAAATFPAWVLAPLVGTSLADAEDRMDRLVVAQLVEPAGRDEAGQLRYRLHDLLRDLARERLELEDSAEDRNAAAQRLAAAYLTIVDHADDHLRAHGPRHTGRVTAPRWPVGESLLQPVAGNSLAWLAAERASLLATITQAHTAGWWPTCWELTDAMSVYFEYECRWADSRAWHQLALDAAGRLGSRAARAALLRNLGEAHRELGDQAQAVGCFEEAIALFEELGDELGLADAIANYARLQRHHGDLDQARRNLAKALRLFRKHNVRRSIGWTLYEFGFIHRSQGRLGQAASALHAAREAFASIDDHRGLGWTLHDLGLVYRDQCGGGHPTKASPPTRSGVPSAAAGPGDAMESDENLLVAARGCIEEALALFAELPEPRGVAWATKSIGELDLLEGKLDDADTRLAHALAALENLGETRGIGLTIAACGTLRAEQGHIDEAVRLAARGVELLGHIGQQASQAWALVRLGTIHYQAGNSPRAQTVWRQAQQLYQHLDNHSAVDALQHWIDMT